MSRRKGRDGANETELESGTRGSINPTIQLTTPFRMRWLIAVSAMRTRNRLSARANCSVCCLYKIVCNIFAAADKIEHLALNSRAQRLDCVIGERVPIGLIGMKKTNRDAQPLRG